MPQTLLREHIKNSCIELCPKCLQCLTPYWSTKSVQRISKDQDLITSERTCRYCGYHEEDKTEAVHLDGCFGCYKCDGGCK